MFGPGDLAFAHTDAEVVPLEQVRRAARVFYAAAALQMLAGLLSFVTGLSTDLPNSIYALYDIVDRSS